MKKITTFLTFLLFSCAFFGQTEIDSLYRVLKQSDKPAEKAQAHGRLSWLFINDDMALAKAHLDTSFTLFTTLKDKRGIALCNYKYGVLYRVSGDYKKSLAYLNKYQEYVESKQDTSGIANILYQKGVVYSMQGDYENSLREYYKTLTIYEKLKDSTSIGFTLNSIGIVYKNLKKYNQAIEAFQKAVGIHEQSNDLKNLANVYNSLGSVYKEINDYDIALNFFKKTLSIDRKTKNNWGTAITLMDIGSVLIEQKQYKMALSNFKEALKIQEHNNYNAEKTYTLIKISDAYLQLGDYANSKLYLDRSSKLVPASKQLHKALEYQKYRLYEKTGKPQQALNHYKRYTAYKDSIFNEENLKNINQLQIQYDIQKKDKELLQNKLKLENQANELQKKKNQNTYIMGIAAFLLLTSILLWVLFQQHQKRKNQEIISLKKEHQIKTLESLMEGEEKERFRIAKELHDGVNGDLSAIKFKLSGLVETNNKVVHDAIAMIDASCKQIRAISHNLVPPSLEKFNLIEATQDYCYSLDAVQPAQIVFQHLGEQISIPKKAEINIFRIIQELVVNSIKHARANEINVQISCYQKNIQIIVEDDGIGYQINTKYNNGIGLANIQSRVDYLQAKMDITSNEQGTSTTIEIETTKII